MRRYAPVGSPIDCRQLDRDRYGRSGGRVHRQWPGHRRALGRGGLGGGVSALFGRPLSPALRPAPNAPPKACTAAASPRRPNGVAATGAAVAIERAARLRRDPGCAAGSPRLGGPGAVHASGGVVPRMAWAEPSPVAASVLAQARTCLGPSARGCTRLMGGFDPTTAPGRDAVALAHGGLDETRRPRARRARRPRCAPHERRMNAA